MNSALYFGTIRHRRHAPVTNAFTYRAFFVHLDLAELDDVFRGRWLWSADRPAAAWFKRSDHLGDPARPLDECVRDLVEERIGVRPAGAVRLLTHLRYWGYCMNPVSFYYCHSAAGDRVEAIVAEIHNTPWGERHCYVLDCRAAARAQREAATEVPGRPAPAPAMRGLAPERWEFEFAKEFHVSPYMPMEMDYAWRFTAPGRFLSVHMENLAAGRTVFDATLTLERREITTRSLAGALARHPFMTGAVIAAIYWQALKLLLKRAPRYPHPGGVRTRRAA